MTGSGLVRYMLLLLIAAALGGCATPASRSCPVPPDQAAESIYLVNHGWHAGLVLPNQAAMLAEWPLSPDQLRGTHVEIGWGDRDFYMAPNPAWTVAVEAVLLPNESVLHVAWLEGPVQASFPGSEIAEIRMSAAGLEQLSRYVARSFATDGSARAIDLGPGQYGDSRFYLSRERYHGFKTCNVWVASALREAGCPVNPAFVLTVNTLMARVRPFATQIHAASGQR